MARQVCSLKVLEDSHVSPPPGSVPTSTVPLTFFDIHWLGSFPMQRLFFFEFPYPTLHFTQTVLPSLKTSFSHTLQHFFPFAGNLVLPPRPQQPYILYKEGDSVPFVVAESMANFNHLAGNHARTIGEFQELLVTRLPRVLVMGGCKQQNAMAVRVTVFPNSGVSIGITFSHAVADGRAFAHFMKSWASIYRAQGDLTSLNGSLPIYNRDLIGDPGGLASIFTKDVWDWEDLSSISLQQLRITTVISRSQIEILKNWVRNKNATESQPEQLRLSAFIVTCAYMWVCLIRSEEREIGDDRGDDKLYHLVFIADCRDRLNLPATYFGNCLEPRFAEAKRNELVGENGVLVAAKAIGREVSELDKGVLKGAEQWLSRAKEVFQSGVYTISVAGSPKLRVYETDFGWGRPKKTEVAHLGSYGAMSISESGGEEGGVEFGLALSQDELEKFNVAFKQGWLGLR
ncbi:hypothetical protein SLA2020_093910 [Shorea laevis]